MKQSLILFILCVGVSLIVRGDTFTVKHSLGVTLDNWYFQERYWVGEKSFPVDKKDIVDKESFSKESHSHSKEGALRIEYSVSKSKHRILHFKTSKFFSGKGMEYCDKLVFHVFLEKGGTEAVITLFNNKTWASCPMGKVTLAKTGFYRFVVKAPKGAGSLKNMNWLDIRWSGDFVLYLSDIYFTNENVPGNHFEERRGETAELEAEDVSGN